MKPCHVVHIFEVFSQSFFLLVVLISSASCWGQALQPDFSAFTVDQVLNNDMPGRKLSPSVLADRDTAGFASERLYSVPPPGVHPRILFGPNDLPRIREQFAAQPEGMRTPELLKKSIEEALSRDDGWGQESFQSLVDGDVKGFEKLWSDPRNPNSDGPPGSGRNPLIAAIRDMAFLALVEEDEALGVRVAAAVTTYAMYLRPRVEIAAELPGADNYWLQIRSVMGDGATVGFMYDFAQPFMIEEQADTVRGLIALATTGRYGLGMDLPPHWVNWNFIGMGLYFPLMALSIEGEPGYDPRIYDRGRDVTKSYILYGNSANGIGSEAVGYHTAGMTHTALMMIAMANRGDNLFTLSRWRRMFDTWLIYSMQPYGKEWQSSGDLGTFPPSSVLMGVAQYLFPSDKLIALVVTNLPERRRLEAGMDIRLLQFICPLNSESAMDIVAAGGSGLDGLPTTLFDEERGVLFTRTGWGADALMLQVNCRSDTTFASHDHADRGTFYLTSHGQAWAVSSMRMSESKYANVVTIDGRGQGHFAPPGEWLDVQISDEAVSAAMNLKYCYDWQWQKTSFLTTDEQLKKQPWLTWIIEPRDRLLSRFPLEQWEQDPLPSVRDYYDGYLAGSPRMWGAEDSWVVRAPHYPVQKAFRTIELVEGDRPYVLVVDDIQKDDKERLYQWRMRMPMQIEAYDMGWDYALLGRNTDRRDRSYRAHLTHNISGRPLPTKGEPMLLVKVLQSNQPDIPGLQDNLTLETLDFVKHDDTFQYSRRRMGLGKRLVIPSRSAEPGFKVLLYPHRHGDLLPETKLSDGKIAIKWPAHEDVFDLQVDDDGRTRLLLQRDP
ncbi:MAG: hypothetical protein AAGI37_15295 [Planctomycetota bacterium]